MVLEIGTILTGITLALIATCMTNVGVALQKKGLMEGLPELTLKKGAGDFGTSFLKYFKNKSWAIGFFLGMAGWIPYVIAQGFVGIVIVQPLQSVGLIVMVIFAHKVLNEKISIPEISAIVLLISSTILIAFSGISSAHIDLHEFVFPFFLFFIVVFSIIFTSILVGRKLKRENVSSLFKIVVAGLLFSLGGLFSNLLAQAFIDSSIRLISPFGWAEVLFSIFWFDYFHLWVFFGFYGLISFNFSGIIFQNNGMQKGKALVLWPIQNGINLIIPIIGGFLIFNQSISNLPIFLLAVILILVATIILGKTQAEMGTLEKSNI
ncbi:MAG: DMT family transporter [Promethearchaeota archaeon]